jgi:hypothetical protein
MVRPSSQNAYSQSAGLAGILAPVQEARDPTSLDVNYVLYREWINTSNDNYWKLMSFDSTSGTVLANWMQLEGTTNEIQTLTGDSGGAVGPTANNVNILGTSGQITVTGNPGTSTLTLALANGGTPIDSITVDASTGPGTNPVVPTAGGLITMTGAQVATGTIGANVIRTDSVAANTMTIEIQRSTAVAATDSTKNGVSHFNSTQFSVDSSGFVSLAGGGTAIDSITPGSGITVVPDGSGNVNFPNGNGIATVGTANTLTTNMASPFTGDFTFQSITSGDTETLTVTNTSNTASSQAQINTVVAGTTAGDAWYQATLGTTRSYAWGIDTSTTNRQWKFNSDASATVSPSSGTEMIILDPVGSPTGATSMQFNTSEFFIRANAGSEVVNLTVRQENAADFADIIAEAVGPKSGFFSSGIYDNSSSPIYWNFGCSATDASLGNAYCLNTSNSTQGPEGGTRIWRANPTGEITMPLQPAFFGYLDSSTPNNVTGDGTVYTVGFNQEVFDQGSDFNPATGTFTVPVTGKYKFTANVLLANLGAAHTAGDISINVAGATAYQFASSLCNPGAGRNPTNQYSMQVTAFASLTAGDTVTVRVNVSNGAKTVGVFGSASPQFWTYFEGSLIC